MDQQRGGNGGGSSDEDRGGSSPERSPNDDRSDAMNPNSDSYESDQANQAAQEERGW